MYKYTVGSMYVYRYTYMPKLIIMVLKKKRFERTEGDDAYRYVCIRSDCKKKRGLSAGLRYCCTQRLN